ncbi:MAG: CAP domain-containing protein [Nitrosotalea sp.]
MIAIVAIGLFLFYQSTNSAYVTIPLPKLSPLPNIQLPTSIPIHVPNFTEITSKPQQLLQQVTAPQQTSQADSKQAIDYINTIRVSNGEKPISFDQRVFDVALARAKDNYDYGYFDHTNPKTGTCSYTIKSQFGLASNEDVAENLYMEGYGNSPSIINPQLTNVIDSWMSDFGHKHNLLYPDHVSGAVACYGGICAFEGLNYQEFGHGCYTASQGQAQFGKLDGCSVDQVKQYLALEQQLDAMKPMLQGMPDVATSQEQYNYYNGLVTQYNNLVNQINNFKC